MVRNFERLSLLLLILTASSTAINAQSPQGTPTTPPYVPSGVAWIYAAGALASALASVIAWLAKIRWGKDLDRSYKARLESKDETIIVLGKRIETMQLVQEQTIKARDERLDSLKEVHAAVLKGKEDEIATLLKSKDGEIATLKSISSPDVMNLFKAQTEQLHLIVVERDKEIEKLKGHVKERPLDAADLALRVERLELEKNFAEQYQAYQMKASSQSFSDLAVSGEDKGKIESARSFLNQLGATQAAHEEKTGAAEAHSEHQGAKGTHDESDEGPGEKPQ